jgi:hypothetical protein
MSSINAVLRVSSAIPVVVPDGQAVEMELTLGVGAGAGGPAIGDPSPSPKISGLPPASCRSASKCCR